MSAEVSDYNDETHLFYINDILKSVLFNFSEARS